jgi:hypothetical protein
MELRCSVITEEAVSTPATGCGSPAATSWFGPTGALLPGHERPSRREMTEHLGFDKYQSSRTARTSASGTPTKTPTDAAGDVEIELPRDRADTVNR